MLERTDWLTATEGSSRILHATMINVHAFGARALLHDNGSHVDSALPLNEWDPEHHRRSQFVVNVDSARHQCHFLTRK